MSDHFTISRPRRTGIRPISLPSGDALCLHLAPFVLAEFNHNWFDSYGIACPDEIARSVLKRQAEFFHGRLAARIALHAIQLPATDVPIGLAREPIWPIPLVGSISHVDGLAGAVVGERTRHLGLGVDLERTALGDTQSALRQTAVSEDELCCLQATTGTLSLDELVTLVFSAKESLYKAAYGVVGRFFGFEAAAVVAVDEVRGVITLEVIEYLHRAFEIGRRCEVAFARLDAETFVTAFEASVR